MWGRVVSARAQGVRHTIDQVKYRSNLNISLSSGKLARLAPGAVVLEAGEATLLATATPVDGHLAVDFRARASARGIIPNTFPRKELAPAPSEILTSRLIDRSLRPVCAHAEETPSISVTLLSSGRPSAVSIDALATNAASAATALMRDARPHSGSPQRPPFQPIGAARVAVAGDQVTGFPSLQDIATSDISIYVAARAGKILALSLDAASGPTSNSTVLRGVDAALAIAHDMERAQLELIDQVESMRSKEGRSDFPRVLPVQQQRDSDGPGSLIGEDDKNAVLALAHKTFSRAFVECRAFPGKSHRAHVLTQAQQQVIDHFSQLPLPQVLDLCSAASREAFREVVLRDRIRIDGRRFDQVRPVRCETGLLPGAVHGSALFDRGDTQVLACATIGLKNSAQRIADQVDTIDGLGDEKDFFVHYSFPGHATGEAVRNTGSTRREVGHSLLAEAALLPVLNTGSTGSFPYVSRLSAEVTSSDGSSSMATVCAGSLALRDAGIPLLEPVAGVAMGMLCASEDLDAQPGEYALLTDILGAEDHFGAIDCKVAGSAEGVTAMQLDVKLPQGLPVHVLSRVLEEAQTARSQILSIMEADQPQERKAMPDTAPRTKTLPIDRSEAIKHLLRDRASLLRRIEKESGTRIVLDPNQPILRIDAPNGEACCSAEALISEALGGIPVGSRLRGKVVEVKRTYALIDTEPGGSRGMLHVSRTLFKERRDEGSARSEGAATRGELSTPDRLTYPDLRRFLRSGQTLFLEVIESSIGADVLRFRMVDDPDEAGHLSANDAFLETLSEDRRKAG